MNKLIAACKALVIARDEWDKLLDQFPSPEMLNAMSDIEDALNALAPAPASVCIDCSGDNKAWVDARSSNNPVHTNFCSKCGHRREVVLFPYALSSAPKVKTMLERAIIKYAEVSGLGYPQAGAMVAVLRELKIDPDAPSPEKGA